MATTGKNSNLILLIRILGFVGIILSVYLLYSFLYHPSFQPCSINTSVNCDAVIKGPVSTFLGLPTALFGLVGYVCILLLSYTKRMGWLLGVAIFGLVFCLRITVIEVTIIHVYCPVCLACQLDMLLLFLIALKLQFTK